MNTIVTMQLRLIIVVMLGVILPNSFAYARNIASVPPNLLVNSVDLELSASSSAPTIFQSGLAEFTIANSGTQTATNIEILFHTNGTVNVTNSPTLSGGIIFDFWTNQPKWVVGTLSPGQKETIEFPIFALSSEINFFGQVSNQNEADLDSTPNNGNNTSPIEDDEASFPSLDDPNGSCTIDVNLISVQCNESDDDFFDFQLNLNAENLSGEGILAYFINGQYCCLSNASGLQDFYAFEMDEGPVEVLIKSADPSDECEATIMVNPPSDCDSENLPNLLIHNFGTNDILQIEPGASNVELLDIELVNLGTAACPPGVGYVTKLYLSEDDEVDDDDDVELSFFTSSGTGINATEAIPSFGIPENTLSGSYYLLIQIDVFESIEEQEDEDNLFALPIQVMEDNPIVDLELTATGQVPSIFQSSTALFTLTNNSTTTASGIEVGFSRNATLGITNQPLVSQGFSQFHWTTTPKWVVGSLEPGESATIEYPIFTFSNDVSLYGQVTLQEQTDIDSAPSNGNGISPIEDDEAVFSNTTGPLCSIELTLIGVTCSAEEGYFDAEVVVSGAIPSGSNTVDYFINNINSGQIAINELSTIQNIPLGLTQLKIADTNILMACEETIEIIPPLGCGQITSCNIGLNSAGVVVDVCDNQGTEDEEDDSFSFSFTPIVNGNSGNYFINRPIINSDGDIVNFPTTSPSGLPTFLNYNIEAAEEAFGDEIEIEIFDADNMDCVITINVPIPETCSDDEALIDLELSAETDVSFIYQKGSAFFTITNNGSATATDVYIEFNTHSSFNITDSPSETQGNANGHWLDTPYWEVGTLAPGQSETAEFPIFTLATELNFYAQVTDHEEDDIDSVPDNGDGITPMEDDETIATMLSLGSRSDAQLAAQSDWRGKEIFVQSIYPNPVSYGQIKLEIIAKSSGLQNINIHDFTGRIVKQFIIELEEGINEITLLIPNLGDGNYYINVLGVDMKYMKTRFVIQRF